MSASGQMPSDYGQHWSPEAAWGDYGPCGCGAQPGTPCLDRRVKHLPPRAMWTAHPDRQCFTGGEMSEDDLLTAVLDMIRLFGLRVAHFRPAKTDKGWRTAVQADGKGYPDLGPIVGPGGLIYRELKSDTGTLTSEQRDWKQWLESAGADFAVWRPSDLRSGRIERELRAIRVRKSERQETR